MAIRFYSFESYKLWMSPIEDPNFTQTFIAGLGAGVTEAVLVVTPMEVLKIRLQAQRHSLADPLDIPKYRNAAHAAYLITKEEGVGALYKGVSLTALRQATNQAVNFTAYQELKERAMKYQDIETLPSYQHLLFGGISGAMGPIANAPIDTIKTRLQKVCTAALFLTFKSTSVAGESSRSRLNRTIVGIFNDGGWRAFYRGLTPRLLRVAPGQAITFMVYEKIQSILTAITE